LGKIEISEENNMRKSIGICLIVLTLSISFIFAQDKIKSANPDLSGTWTLNQKASDKIAKNYEDYTVKISVSGKEIKISRNYKSKDVPVNYTLTLFADKSGEKNLIPYAEDLLEIESETYWKKDQLYRDYEFFRSFASMQDKIFRERFTEKYELSEDGEKLTIISTSRPSTQLSGIESPPMKFVPITTKLVFSKMEG
jgi:hypothetical protein